jgi:curved DNA-binding protein
MDHYSTLGVSKNASEKDIKTAFRKLAAQHHPDKGGDHKKFVEIKEAYETLSNPQKRQMYDQFGTADPNQRQHQYRSQNFSGGFDDIFDQMFSNFGFRGQAPNRNSTIQAEVTIELEDVLFGKSIDAEIGFRNGQTKLVTINIPRGVYHGSQIRYPGMGDQSNPKAPPGDLIVRVNVNPHYTFKRQEDNLIIDHNVSVYDAILGTEIKITTLDRKTFTVTVPAGSQPDTVLSCKGEGLPNPHNGPRGNLLIRVKVKIPKNLNKKQIRIIADLKNGKI